MYTLAAAFIWGVNTLFLGLFVPTLKEVQEMNYQYDHDYEFLSDKFNKRFNLEPTRYLEGIKAVVETDYR